MSSRGKSIHSGWPNSLPMKFKYDSPPSAIVISRIYAVHGGVKQVAGGLEGFTDSSGNNNAVGKLATLSLASLKRTQGALYVHKSSTDIIAISMGIATLLWWC